MNNVHAPSNLEIPSKGRDMITKLSNPGKIAMESTAISRRTLIGGRLANPKNESRNGTRSRIGVNCKCE
jgi:hypothetical protein